MNLAFSEWVWTIRGFWRPCLISCRKKCGNICQLNFMQVTGSTNVSSCVTVKLRANIWLNVFCDSYKMTSHIIVTLKITSNHVRLTSGHANGFDGIWRRVVWQKFTRIFREKFSRMLQILPKRLLTVCIVSLCIFFVHSLHNRNEWWGCHVCRPLVFHTWNYRKDFNKIWNWNQV